jgi:NO-binding membrane sensor protein with MHYT domain
MENLLALTQAYTIVLAILIAMIATCVAFFTFFRLRAHWQDNFIKRSACALVLAIAVCGKANTGCVPWRILLMSDPSSWLGMHYVGLWGTSFSVRSSTNPADLAAGERKIVRITIGMLDRSPGYIV